LNRYVEDGDRTRAPVSPGPRAVARGNPSYGALQQLQRTAGNQATAAYVRAQLTATHGLQRVGLSDVVDAYHHVRDWFHRDKPKPEEEEDWSENSEDVARHGKQVLEVAQFAYQHLANEAQRHGNSHALREANEAVERIERVSGYLETGEKIFKTSVKTFKIIQECSEMLEAARALADADLGDPKTQQRAAEALDKLAGGFGHLGSELLPATPAKAYFDFLGKFSSARFFAHWTEFIHDYTGRIDAASRSD
jgi:DNA repair ATPase RecN